MLLVGLLFAACTRTQTPSEKPRGVLRLATTTSTQDSGLLDVLIPIFQRQQKCRVDVVAVGTGAALKLGEAGDMDVLLVHARAAEDAFMGAEHGIRREEVMFNYFEILGPPGDPAGTRGVGPATALQRIASGRHRFVSRGDDSGTHKREVKLWEQCGSFPGRRRPEWGQYVESGQGMGATLVMADQMGAYVLTDHGTYLKFKHKIGLRPLVTSSERLRNPYGVIVVNPRKHPRVNVGLARAFADFMMSRRAQEIIRDYKFEGERLFYPLGLPGEN